MYIALFLNVYVTIILALAILPTITVNNELWNSKYTVLNKCCWPLLQPRVVLYAFFFFFFYKHTPQLKTLVWGHWLCFWLNVLSFNLSCFDMIAGCSFLTRTIRRRHCAALTHLNYHCTIWHHQFTVGFTRLYPKQHYLFITFDFCVDYKRN